MIFISFPNPKPSFRLAHTPAFCQCAAAKFEGERVLHAMQPIGDPDWLEYLSNVFQLTASAYKYMNKK
jgi:hypothetical protein